MSENARPTPAEPRSAALPGFDIRGPLPTGTTLIEASAGTGKTWTVAALVIRYVAELGVPLDRLLVVTFSRAASQELRERVRAQLELVTRQLARPASDTDDALVTHLRDCPDHERAQRVARLRAALADFDTATIATIHQFCQLVLSSLGVAGDSDSFAELVEDLSDLRDEVAADTFLARSRADKLGTLTFSDLSRYARSALDHPSVPIEEPRDARLNPQREFMQAVRDEFHARKRRGSVLSFDDLLSELDRALASPDSPARQRMRDLWDVVLVDEFQDTDPVQWSVFSQAFGGDDKTLILIGDPKQAIYGFRGGDVQTYLQAAGSAATRYSLPVNYRSDGPLVDALQLLMAGVQLSPGIVAHPITAKHTEARFTRPDSEAAVHLRYENVTAKSVGVARAFAARDAAQEIAALLGSGAQLNGKKLQPHDIAVLAFRHADLHLVREELRHLRIHSVLTSGESVLRTVAGNWWMQLLMAMELPQVASRVRAAMITPLIGWSAEELVDSEERTDEAAAVIRGLLAAYGRGGIAAVLDELRAQGLSARLLGSPLGERDLTDVEHCAQLLQEQVLAGARGLSSLLAWFLDRTAEDATVGADARVIRLDSDARAVTLSTIHGSKGLQYPVVLTPFIWDTRDTSGDDAPFVLHKDGRRTICLDPHSDNRELNGANNRDEAMRLAYVAMTRAQSHLIMWWLSTPQNTTMSALNRLLFGQALGTQQVHDLVQQRRELLARRAQDVTTDVSDFQPIEPQPRHITSPDSIGEQMKAWADASQGLLQVVENPRHDVGPVPREPSESPLSVREFDPRVVDHRWRRTSYTALSAAGEEAVVAGTEPEAADLGLEPDADLVVPTTEADGVATQEDPALAAPSPMADLPKGATFGSLVHGVLEESDWQADDLGEELLEQVREQLQLWPVDVAPSAVAEALVQVCRTPLGPLTGDLTLERIAAADRIAEMDFEVPLAGGDSPRAVASTLRAMASHLREHLGDDDPLRPYAEVLESTALGEQHLRGYLTGSIDLTFRHDGRYYVVDYKTNRLGDPEVPLTVGEYTPERLAAAMNHSSYPLQAILYSVVLHRYLRWRLPGYDPQQHLGGVMYLYVRGMAGPDTPRVDGQPCGVFSWAPRAELVVALSNVLDGVRDSQSVSMEGAR